VFGAFFLQESQYAVEHHDGQDRQGVGPLAKQSGDHGRDDQDDDHQFFELAEQLLPPGHRRGLGQLVEAVA